MTINKKEYNEKDFYYELSKQKYEVVRASLNKDVKLHFHDYLECELVLDGTAVQYINNFKTILKRGSFTILRPGIDCHSLEIKNLEVVKFYVKSYFINEEIWKEISLLLDPLVVELEGEELEHIINLFKAAEFEQKGQEKYTDEIVENIINSLLSVFIRSKVGHENNSKIRKQIIKYLLDDNRYLTDVSLQDFANYFKYSLSHASKYFKENTGMNFSEAKQYFRIQNAKRLLLSSDYSINEISSMCGFNYYHLFHNLFKKNTGITPFEFRKQNR